ncbi:hypothetical protein H0H87_010282 [Tephrocybe sp. NHM501043]|nr:hypothetical protein H0H87_010282 [Tephrocybe sp. NHM501043]
MYEKGMVSDKEVNGLKAVGQFIAVEEANVVMKEVIGTTLAEMMAKKTTRAQQEEFLLEWKPRVAQAAAKIAQEKGIFHIDLGLNNVIIDKDEQVHLIDWENYATKKDKDLFKDNPKKIEEGNLYLWTPTIPSPKGSPSSHTPQHPSLKSPAGSPNRVGNPKRS